MATFVNGKWVYDSNDRFDVVTGKPLGQVQGATTDLPEFGAGGRGENLDQNAAISNEAMDRGVPVSEIGNYQNDLGYRIPAPSYLSREESAGVSQSYGLQGISKPGEYAGLTRAEANAKASQKQQQLKSQTSQNTSYAYNPQTISGFNSKINELKARVDETNNYAWDNPQQKKDNNTALIRSYGDQLAGLFGSQEDFVSAMQNPDTQQALQKFQSIGGNPSDIASKISQSPVADGGIPSPYQEDGSQTTDQYLGNLSSPEAQKAYQDLIPERQISQQRIAFE